MTSTFSTSPDLKTLGPTITVKITPSSALKNSLTTPEEKAEYNRKTYSALMLIDTGSSCSVIDTGVASHLGLQPHGNKTVHTPGPSGGRTAYDIDLYFHDGKFHVQNLNVVESSTLKSNQGIDGLIGRDILESAVFIYQGENGQYTLAF